MGIGYFDAQPIPEVIAFIEKHYDGGTVLDYGCGSGRYAKYFPKDKYLGVDGDKDNVDNTKKYGRKAEVHDLETWEPEKSYDYLFSSVAMDQLENLPMGWADKYILVENKKYRDIYNVIVDEPLQGSEETRLMICE